MNISKFRCLVWDVVCDEFGNVSVGCTGEEGNHWHVLIIGCDGTLRLVREVPDDIGLSLNDEGQINITDS